MARLYSAYCRVYQESDDLERSTDRSSQAAPTLIALSVKDNAIRLLLSEELEKRLADRKTDNGRPSRHDMLYRDHVLQADEGCDFDFLRESEEIIRRHMRTTKGNDLRD